MSRPRRAVARGTRGSVSVHPVLLALSLAAIAALIGLAAYRQVMS